MSDITLEGSPLVSGTQYGPYKVARGYPVRGVPTPLLWGGGRTNMYWKGPAPFAVPVPTLRLSLSLSMRINVNISQIKGQTPYDYTLLISESATGPFVDSGANTTQVHVGDNQVFFVNDLTPSTAYYFVVVVSNGFGYTYSGVSPPFTTLA